VTKINRQFLEETLVELDARLECTEQDNCYRTALVLLAAITCGSDTTCLARITELPLQFVSKIRQRMIRAQLWTEIYAACDHWYWPKEPWAETNSAMEACIAA